MSDKEYEEYKKQCEKIRSENDVCLDLFEEDMKAQGLSDKTISRHISNVSFYINQYLLREDARLMTDGVTELDMFLGDFFIRKCMWSTPRTIKSTAASIKKFYKSMFAHGRIQKSDYEILYADIKDRMEYWQEDCAAFNDPGSVNPFAFF